MKDNKKSAPNFSVQDASAALPQNCQTTKWIVVNYRFSVNVTLVIGFFRLRTATLISTPPQSESPHIDKQY